MSDDAAEYEYPPACRPKGAEPPRRPDYAPKPRSGLVVTGDEAPDEEDYPQAWR